MNSGKKFLKKVIALIAAMLMVLCMVFTSGCDNNSQEDDGEQQEKVEAIVYKDKSIAALVSNIFSKPASNVTEQELASIRYLGISYYDGTYSVTVGFDDYMKALENKDENSNSLLLRTTTSAITGFEDMKLFKGLKTLNLFNIYTFNDFNDLKYCTELETISIHTDTKNAALKKLDGIENLGSLRDFGLYGAIITDLSPLSSLVELKSLSIGADYRMYEETDENFYDIEALSELDKLESLSIVFSGVSDLSPIADAPIKYLSVYRSGLSDISVLENMTSLEEVSLTYNAIEDVTPLTKLPNLKFINLDYNYISDVSPFAKLDRDTIEYVSMDMNSVEDWTPVRDLYEQKKLYTGYDLYFED